MMPDSPDNNSGLNLSTTNKNKDLTKTMTSATIHLRGDKGVNGSVSRPHSRGCGSNGNGGGGSSNSSSNGSPSPPSTLQATSSVSLTTTATTRGTIVSNGITTSSTTAVTSTNVGVTSSNGGSTAGRSRLGSVADVQATICGSRQLSKVKRFLTTLQQFGTDISTEAGERVRNLILSLVNDTLTIDEFHLKLQETTNFPLRPFVIPFLKANLPLLQREILHCARIAKLSPQQYLHQHENLVLDPAHSPTNEPLEIFHHMSELNDNGKRRLSDVNNRLKENGNAADQLLDLHGPPPKRHHHHHPLLSPTLSLHPTSSSSLGIHPSLPLRLDDYALARELRERDRLCLDREYRHYVYSPRDILDERETEEEWKNIHTMLNCILGMVEKTKRALAILQHRSQTDRQELAMWIRRHTEGTENNLKKQAGDMMAQTLKTTEDRVSEVKRRAEDAVNEVKRQAVVELQKAVSAADEKARELVASERSKMEKLIVDARRQATDEARAALNQQSDSHETCWNCGRKGYETCSGCNVARYCGAYCQHKDWETHLRSCGQGAHQLVVSQTVSSSLSSAVASSTVTSNSSVPTTTNSASSTIPSGAGGGGGVGGGGGSTSTSGSSTVIGNKTSSTILLSNLTRSNCGSRSSTPVLDGNVNVKCAVDVSKR